MLEVIVVVVVVSLVYVSFIKQSLTAYGLKIYHNKNTSMYFLPHVIQRMQTLTKSPCLSSSSDRLSILSRKGTPCSDGGGRDGTN